MSDPRAVKIDGSWPAFGTATERQKTETALQNQPLRMGSRSDRRQGLMWEKEEEEKDKSGEWNGCRKGREKEGGLMEEEIVRVLGKGVEEVGRMGGGRRKR